MYLINIACKFGKKYHVTAFISDFLLDTSFIKLILKTSFFNLKPGFDEQQHNR